MLSRDITHINQRLGGITLHCDVPEQTELLPNLLPELLPTAPPAAIWLKGVSTTAAPPSGGNTAATPVIEFRNPPGN
jgi:hypothetical protein